MPFLEGICELLDTAWDNWARLFKDFGKFGIEGSHSFSYNR